MKRRGCSPFSKSKHNPPPLLADCRGATVHHSAAGPPQHHPSAASSAPCRRGRRRPWSLPQQRPHETDLYQPFFFSPLFCFHPQRNTPGSRCGCRGCFCIFRFALGFSGQSPRTPGRARRSAHRLRRWKGRSWHLPPRPSAAPCWCPRHGLPCRCPRPWRWGR